MDAVGEAACRQVGDGRLRLLEVLAHADPVVDHEEHVGEPRAVRPPVRLDAVDALLGEPALPLGEDGGDLGERAVDAVGIQPVRHAADVRQRPEAAEGAATEVEAVDPHLLGRVGQRQ